MQYIDRFSCPRCGKHGGYKHHLIRHLKIKRICKLMEGGDDRDRTEIIDEVSKRDYRLIKRKITSYNNKFQPLDDFRVWKPKYSEEIKGMRFGKWLAILFSKNFNNQKRFWKSTGSRSYQIFRRLEDGTTVWKINEKTNKDYTQLQVLSLILKTIIPKYYYDDEKDDRQYVCGYDCEQDEEPETYKQYTSQRSWRDWAGYINPHRRNPSYLIKGVNPKRKKLKNGKWKDYSDYYFIRDKLFEIMSYLGNADIYLKLRFPIPSWKKDTSVSLTTIEESKVKEERVVVGDNFDWATEYANLKEILESGIKRNIDRWLEFDFIKPNRNKLLWTIMKTQYNDCPWKDKLKALYGRRFNRDINEDCINLSI